MDHPLSMLPNFSYPLTRTRTYIRYIYYYYRFDLYFNLPAKILKGSGEISVLKTTTKYTLIGKQIGNKNSFVRRFWRILGNVF